jgi:hypothetical protein
VRSSGRSAHAKTGRCNGCPCLSGPFHRMQPCRMTALAGRGPLEHTAAHLPLAPWPACADGCNASDGELRGPQLSMRSPGRSPLPPLRPPSGAPSRTGRSPLPWWEPRHFAAMAARPEEPWNAWDPVAGDQRAPARPLRRPQPVLWRKNSGFAATQPLAGGRRGRRVDKTGSQGEQSRVSRPREARFAWPKQIRPT